MGVELGDGVTEGDSGAISSIEERVLASEVHSGVTRRTIWCKGINI